MPKNLHLKMPAILTGVIFDCDGVILNSREANCLYYNTLLKALGLPAQTKEQEAYTHMSTVREAFEHIIPKELYPEFAKIYRTAVNYQRDIMPHITLEDGFLDFINFLKKHNIRLAIHTNRFDGMPAILEQFKLHGFFDPVITAADVIPKPNPDGIHKILQKWNTTVDSIFFVGDSINDQQAACAAKVSFVGYANQKLDAAVNVDTFAQLKMIVSKKYICS